MTFMYIFRHTNWETEFTTLILTHWTSKSSARYAEYIYCLLQIWNSSHIIHAGNSSMWQATGLLGAYVDIICFNKFQLIATEFCKRILWLLGDPCSYGGVAAEKVPSVAQKLDLNTWVLGQWSWPQLWWPKALSELYVEMYVHFSIYT